MADPLIQIVDAEDRPLRGGTREEAKTNELWHRVVRVIIESPSGKVLLQKRAPQVFYNPNKWDHSAAGHVDEGESYEDAASRELEEELGVKAPLENIDYLKSERPDEAGKTRRLFATVYRAIVEETEHFNLQEDEVSEVRWFSVDEMKRMADDEPELLTPGLRNSIQTYYSNKRI